MKYEFDRYEKPDTIIIIKVFENEMLCGLLTGYIKWITHEIKVYPRKSLVAYWRYNGPRVLKVEQIEGMR